MEISTGKLLIIAGTCCLTSFIMMATLLVLLKDGEVPQTRFWDICVRLITFAGYSGPFLIFTGIIMLVFKIQ